MVQILTPTPLIGTPRFPTTNPAIAAYNEQEDQGIRRRADERQQNQEHRTQTDWEKRRSDESAEDQAGADVVTGLDGDPAPSTTVPIKSPTIDQNDEGNAITPAPAAPSPTVETLPLATPPSSMGLSQVTAQPAASPAAALPAPVQPPAETAPPPTITPPPAAQPVPKSAGLGAVTARKPTVAGMDIALGKRLAKSGLGRKAFDLTQKGLSAQKQDLETEYGHAREVLEAANAGDMARAELLIRQYGITDIDPQVLNDGKARKLMSTVLYYAKGMNALHDQAWQHKFAQAYQQTGDAQAALRAAGIPEKEPNKPNTFGHVVADGKVRTYDTTTGKPGSDLGAAPTTGAGTRQTNEQINYAWMIKPRAQGGLGLNPRVAQDMIRNVKENPGARTRSIMTMASGLLRDGPAGMTAESATQEATKAYEKIEQTYGKKSVTPAAPAAAPTGAPAPAAAAPPAAAPPAPQPEDDKEYFESEDGKTQIYHVKGDPEDVFYRVDDDTRYEESP